MSKAKGVEAVNRALNIVKTCVAADAPQSLAELSRQTGYYKSTVLRLIDSLQDFGYVARRVDGMYQAGPTLLQLGRSAMAGFDLAATVRPALRALSEQTRETASVYVKRGSQRECLFRHEPDRSIRHILAEGARLPLHSGASGHVISAWEGKPRGEAHPAPSEFTLSLGERDPEVAAIAVPVFDVEGAFFGALTVSGLITRFETEEAQTRLRAALTETARSLHEAGLVLEE